MAGRHLVGVLAAALGCTAGEANAQSRGAEIVQSLGLIGTWAVDCSKPPANQNPFQTYYIEGDGRPARRLWFEPREQPRVYEVSNPSVPSPGMFAYDSRERGAGTETHFKVVLEVKNGRMRSYSSVAADGRVLIREGKFTSDGKDTPTLEKCVRTQT